MKIIRLEIDNIGGVEAFELDADGKHVVIGGPNGAGKTSILNAIAGALGGGRNRKRQKVRSGAKAGSVVVDLGDLVVKWRTNDEGRDYLSVENKDGAVYKSPQKMLDRLWGDRTFDPLAFFDADQKTQAKMLVDLAGIDLESLDRKRRRVFDERTSINRVAKELAAQANDPAYEVPDDTPDEPVDVDAITSELLAATNTNNENQKLRDDLERLTDAVIELQEQLEQVRIDAGEVVEQTEESSAAMIRDAEKALEQAKKTAKERVERAKEKARKAIQTAKERKEKADKVCEELGKQVDELKDIEIEELEKRMEGAREVNRAVEMKRSKGRLLEGVKAQQAKATELTEQIVAIDAEKAEALEQANLPIDGLGLEDGIVTWRGKGIDLLSASERLRVSVALGLAINSEIGVMLIDRWNDLDDERRALVREMADSAGCQIWSTVVGEKDPDITVAIREGRKTDG